MSEQASTSAVEQDRGGDPLLAKRLRAARDDAGLTQQELSELVGISQRSVSDLETERRGKRVDPALVRRLAEVLGVTAGYLMGDSGEPYDIPGWDALTPTQRAEIRALISLRARLNRDLARVDNDAADLKRIGVSDETDGEERTGYG